MQADKISHLRRAVLARLEILQQVGVLQIPRMRLGARPVEENASVEVTCMQLPTGNAPFKERTPGEQEVPMPKKASPPPTAGQFEVNETSASAPSVDTSLEVIREEVAACVKCTDLARTRTQTVFGVGNPRARLCFLGEAPGADEDRLGEPFVGRGGQLLNKIIEACRIKREDIYILNMLKCRPPGNRNPLPTELANCRGYLDRQLALIQPEFICCWGAIAAQNLLGTPLSIGKLRGKIHNYRGIKVVCTYHPAFLLRSPSYKKETWEDMKMLFREMGVNL